MAQAHFFLLAVLILIVDFRSRRLRFPRACRGASSAHLRLRGLPCPLLPQESSPSSAPINILKINYKLYHSLLIKILAAVQDYFP
jgi:hypothetical protein